MKSPSVTILFPIYAIAAGLVCWIWKCDINTWMIISAILCSADYISEIINRKQAR